MRDVQNPSHLIAENIDYEELIYSQEVLKELINYPSNLQQACQELNSSAQDSAFVNNFDKTINVYRGDSKANLEDFGYSFEDNSVKGGALTREFPIYFTTSEAEAVKHADRKNDEIVYLLELEVPFDSLEIIENANPKEVARNHGQMDLGDSKLYFNQSSRLRGSLEWVSNEIPEAWVEKVTQL